MQTYKTKARTSDSIEVRRGGKTLILPMVKVDNQILISIGRWLKIASIHDDELVVGQVMDGDERFIRAVKKSALKADIFKFAQHLPEITPKYSYYMELDNVAVIPITTFEDWWNERVSSNLRKDVRRSQKRGIAVRVVEFNDEFIQGVVSIYNETPIRQGRPFWHFQKGFERVKAETSTYLERSEFIGAYFNDELVGFLKIVYVGQVARLMYILSKIAYQDSRPTNALIAKAVEVCALHKCSHLTYGNYTYGNKTDSSLAAFKQRNGFEQVLFPQYYVPLTLKGALFLKLRLHHGFRSLIPENFLNVARRARAMVLQKYMQRRNTLAQTSNEQCCD